MSERTTPSRNILAVMALLLSGLLTGEVVAQSVPVPGTYGDAMRWYRNAARAGDAKAQFYLGLSLEQSLTGEGDLGEAIIWFRRSAEQGYTMAQFKLAVALQQGRSVAKDLPEAREWYEKAAAGGMAQATFNLALMQANGDGGPADLPASMGNFEKAARDGIDPALLQMAFIRADTTPEMFDLVEAARWAFIAEARNVAGSRTVADILRSNLDDAGIADANKRAAEWQAAAQ